MTEVLVPAAAKAAHDARVRLLNHLERAGYAFVSSTPATHRLVAERSSRARAGNLRDVFGWGRAFHPDDLPPEVLDDLRRAGALIEDGSGCRSSLRVSTLDDRLHLHSSRGDDPQAVFLGPDSYRFVRFLDEVLAEAALPRRALDIGTGAGAGALTVASRARDARVTAGDINPMALGLAAANAAHAGLDLDIVEGSGLDAVSGDFDLIIANPPYIAGDGGRLYRDGGGALGGELALSWIEAGLTRLTPSGRFALYTGSPVVEGRHLLRDEIERLARTAGARVALEELDPDVFGGTLRQPAYRDVERIAAVGVVMSL